MWNVVFLSYITDTDNDMTFSVLHIKGNRPVIEPTVDHSGSHVKWNVTSLSPVGPIIQTSQAVEHHGVVLVYKQLTTDNNSYSFHVYLGTNSASDIKVSGVFLERSPTSSVLVASRLAVYFQTWHMVLEIWSNLTKPSSGFRILFSFSISVFISTTSS